VNRPCAADNFASIRGRIEELRWGAQAGLNQTWSYSLCKGALGTSLSRLPIVLPSEWSALRPV
jgi:hypothetical protein